MFIVARGYKSPQLSSDITLRPASNPFVHQNLDEAQKEAERLARETGGAFYVFMALSVSETQQTPVKTTFL